MSIAPRSACWPRPAGIRPSPEQYPTGAELVERYLEPLATSTALARSIHTSSRVTDISRVGFDKLKTKGRGAAPFELRYQNGQGPKGMRADAVIDASGTWHSPNPAGANGLRAIGERAGGGQDRLRHAGRARQGSRPLCRQDRCGARRGTFGGRHPDRSRAAGVASRRNRSGLAVARQRSCQGFWRRRQRQARRARRDWDWPWRRWSQPANQSGSEFRVSHLTADGARLTVSAGAGCCGRRSSADELIVATGFPSGSRFRARTSHPARSRDRMPGRAGAADRSQRTQLRHGAAPRRARTGAGTSRASISPA